MLAPQQHDITHPTSTPMEASAGYNGYDAIMRESGRPDLEEKSAQSTFKIVETPMRPAITFLVLPQQQRDRRWWHRIGRPGILVLTVSTGVTFSYTALLIFLWNGTDRARTVPIEQEAAIIEPNSRTISSLTAGQVFHSWWLGPCR